MQDERPDQMANQREMSPAILRMTRSRIALRQVLQHGNDSNAKTHSFEHASINTFDSLFGLLKGQPSAQLLLQAAQGILANNTWMILGKNAFEASNVLLIPIAKRSPMKLVAGAFVVGAVLCLAQPWRLIKKNTLLSSLLQR